MNRRFKFSINLWNHGGDSHEFGVMHQLVGGNTRNSSNFFTRCWFRTWIHVTWGEQSQRW